MSKKLLTFLTLLTLFFGVGWAETAEFAFGSMGFSTTSHTPLNNVTLNPTSGSGVTLLFNNGTNTSNAPQYNKSKYLQFYANNTLVINAGANTITQVDFVFSSNYTLSSCSCTSGNYVDDSNNGRGTWTGSTSSLTITNTKSGQARLLSITVTYTSGGSTYTISYGSPEHGTIDGPQSAIAATEVTLSADPDDGYEFGSWNVKDASNNSITVTNNKFTMPASNVTVNATFTALSTYSINVTGGTASPTSTYEGQTVTLTPTIPDGKVIDWDNTTVTPSTVVIDPNNLTFTMPGEPVTIVFAFKDAPNESTATLTNANIVAAGDGQDGYRVWEMTDENDKTWSAYAIKNKHSNATSSYHYLQIKKSTTTEQYYIQVPEYGTKITRLEMTVSGSNQPMTGGGNSATIFFSSSNTTSSTGTGVASGTGASSVAIDCSSLNLNTGYITAGGAVRIWDVTVYYENGEVTSNNLYIIGQVNGLSGWSATKAVKMTYDGSKYTAKIFVTGEANGDLNSQGQGTHGGTFAFTTKIGSWDDVNSNRYEPPFADEEGGNKNWWLATSGATNSGQLYKKHYDNSFLIPAGLYEIEVSGDLTTYNLKTIKDLTPAFTPASGEVNVGSNATLATAEDFNAFIANCNAFEGTDEETTVVTPEVKLYINNNEASTYNFATAGEVTLIGKAALVASGTEYARKTTTETYNAVQKYTATIASGITGGSVSFSETNASYTTLNNLTAGYTVNVYVTPSTNYQLSTLTYTAEGSTTPVNITMSGGVYCFAMPPANVTINATFTYNGPAVTGVTYELINSTEALEVGKKYLVVYETSNYALGGTGNGAYSITIDNHQTTINSDSEVSQFVLGGSEGAWTLYNGSGYLYHTGTSASSVNQTGDGTDDASKWTISFSGDNVTLTSKSSNRLLRYYNQDFRAYQSTSNGQNIQLYKEIGVNDPKFSIPAGTFQNSDYPNGINVALTCATDGATIYYSTDGTNFSEYSSAISVTETTTIYAYATKDGKQSNTVSATYTFVDFLVADVVFSPASGEYYHNQTCQMFSTTKGARIYYTTDGSDPVMNQGTTRLYTGEIPMTAGNTYNFKAVAYIGTTPSEVTNANYTILTGDYPGSYNYLYSIAELNAHEQSTNFWTMVNPVQVVYMSTYQNDGETPEFCLVRDNTGYGLIYFGKNNSYHSGYKIFEMGDWIPGAYYGPISWAYSQNDGQLDTHPELGDSYTTSARVRNWPTSAISNSIVLPEYLTIPEILSSDPEGDVDYWGHYVHLRKNKIELTSTDQYGKWSGTITDPDNNVINYYDKFYLQYGDDFSDWTTESNMFTGHPNRTFDVYGFVACHLPADIDYQISPFDFAWIDKPVIDKETATYYEPQTVTISSPEDPNATIWYKTSEMDDYAVYTEPFTVNSTTTIEWYATKQSQYNDELESLGGSITMTFEEIAKPVITPESQVKAVGESVDASIAYEAGVTVADGAVIMYTTDGSDPKTSETAQQYTLGTTLTFTTTTTVRAITKVGDLYSAEADAKTYTFVKSNGIEYTLVTDVRNLNENGVYVIVSQNYSEALSTTQNTTNRGAAGVLFVEDTNKAKVYGNDDVAQFTLTVLTHDEDTSPERHFLMQTNNSSQNGYLYVGSESNNTLLTEANEDAMGNDVAVITIDADGRAHIHFNYAGGDNRYLQYWNRDRLFNTYKSEYDDRAVYIYGVNATPLATIEKEGTALPTTTTAENQYTIADQLIAVHYVDAQNTAGEFYLWCKDQGNVSISKTEKNEGQTDYLREVAKVQGEWSNNTFESRDWDQSNWVVLKFTNPADETSISNAVGHYIKPASITGHYTDDVNFTITMPAGQGLPADVIGGDAGFTPNVYCPANFLDVNLNINGGEGPAGTEPGERYFFMNPKIQEVATVTFAVWNGTCFVVPAKDDNNNHANVAGAFSVDWSLNKGGNVTAANANEMLRTDVAYKFLSVLNTVSGSKAGSEVPNVSPSGSTPQGNKVVYPLNLNGGENTDNIVTAIKDVVDVTDKTVAGVKYYNLAGIESDRPFEGVNIIVTTYTDGSRSSSKVLK